jgi:adenine phosphoribosyltransferase
MVRKPGKLPGDVVTLKYDLEYGSNELQVQKNAFDPGSRVLVIDDVLATGGTAGATAELIALIDSHVVGYAFVIELEYLNGRAQLGSIPVQSLCVYTDSNHE